MPKPPMNVWIHDWLWARINKDKKKLMDFLLSRTAGVPGCDCVVWTEELNADGYGRFSARLHGTHRKLMAHKVFFTLYHGRPIADGMEMDHKCERRACVNPLHMEEVSPEVNKSRRYGRRAKEQQSEEGIPFNDNEIAENPTAFDWEEVPF